LTFLLKVTLTGTWTPSLTGKLELNMFRKRTPLEWIAFLIVLAMVVGLLWLATHLEKASF
jgi:hypothetical protein